MNTQRVNNSNRCIEHEMLLSQCDGDFSRYQSDVTTGRKDSGLVNSRGWSFRSSFSTRASCH